MFKSLYPIVDSCCSFKTNFSPVNAQTEKNLSCHFSFNCFIPVHVETPITMMQERGIFLIIIVTVQEMRLQ